MAPHRGPDLTRGPRGRYWPAGRSRTRGPTIRRTATSPASRTSSGSAPYAGHGTTHFSVIDGDGMAVSCTHTVANAFGCKVMAEGTGAFFDSSMAWFNASPGTANSIAPGKRPLANMGPLLVRREGRPLLALGAPGGRRIISALTQVLSNVVDRGMGVQEAISAPRVDASGTTVLVFRAGRRGRARAAGRARSSAHHCGRATWAVFLRVGASGGLCAGRRASCGRC
ncbi:gamma-glutamyltransferase [Streptomyces sp. NBC_00063]|uniref:gamma-glutamyltransferase n=1 Tax=Streptomyces sp. NBC_00063 TaxID=2975638 RepID=UPI003D73AF50